MLNTTRRKRKDYFADGSNVYIEQWLVVGGDAAKTEWRRRLLCKGGTVWQVAEMDKVLASRAREAGINVPHEVEEAAMDRVVFRASADKLDLTRDDDEPVIPRQLIRQVVQNQPPAQDAGGAYPSPTSDAIEIDISCDDASGEETYCPRRPISPELGVGFDTTQQAPSFPSRRRSRLSTVDFSPQSQAKRPRRRNFASAGRQLPRKKDVSICPGEDPATNSFHEAHLFAAFRLPSSDKIKKQTQAKQLFRLNNVMLMYGEETTDYRSLLDLAKVRSRSGLELVGLAFPFEHGGRDGDQQDDSNDDEGDETQREGLEGDGRRRVRLVATDFVNLKPETFMDDSTSEDCALVLETRLARYLIGSPAKEYLDTFQDAPVLLNLLAWGSFCEVRPSTSTKDPLGDLRRNLNASLRSPREMDAYLFRAVNLEYHLDTPLSESLASIKSDVLDLLQQWLPNPIFITPFVYEHLRRLRVNTGALVRTELTFDAEAAQRRIDADESVLASLSNIFQLSLATEATLLQPGQASGRAFFTRRTKTTKPIAVIFFEEMELDGTVIRIGDYVMVKGSEKKRAPDRTQPDGGDFWDSDDDEPTEQPGSSGEGDKVWWVARVVYFSRAATGALQAHLSWLQRATQTWLGSVAPPLLLFYGDWCSSEPADSIVSKLDVERLPIKTMRPSSECLHYCYAYDPTDCSYTEASLLEDLSLFPLCDASKVPACACCERRMAEDAELLPVYDPALKSLKVNGFVFHRRDFVYVSTSEPDNEGHPPSLRLALLEKIDGPKLQVRWLFRHDEVFESVRDPRRLVLSDVVAEIQPERLEGTFRLEHTARLKKQEDMRRATQDQDRKAKGQAPVVRRERSDDDSSAILLQSYLSQSLDHFYIGGQLVDSPYDLTSGSPPLNAQHGEDHRRPLAAKPLERLLCSVCARTWADEATSEQVLLGLRRKHPSLRHPGLEGYAGAGGLMKGVESACHAIVPSHAVEIDSFARELLEINAGSSVVCDARPFSQVVEAVYSGEASSMAFDYVGAGPPCQGFSSLNRFKSPEDRRTFEPLAWVSGLDVFHPLVALFENVRGITSYNLPVLPGAAPVPLLATLNMLNLLLGYQCRTAVLNAASHGAPQSRRRLIMVLTPRSLTLPELPIPTHSFTLRHTQLNLDDSFEKSRSHVSQRRCDGIAPHPAVTIADAISDLPPKEMALGTIEEDRLPFAPEIWSPGATLGDGGQEEYRRSAPSRYQLSARIVLSGQDYETISQEVRDHYFKTPSSELVVQRYIRLGIAGEPGQFGNYRDLEGLEEGARPVPPRGVLENPKKLETWWQRLRWTDVATTIRTSLNGDGSSHGPRVHPFLRRLLTIRELARLQGFDDAFHFGSQPGVDNTEAQIRAIGNAVPGQLGSAIGREIQAMLSETILAHVARYGEGEAAATFDKHRALALGYHDERRERPATSK